MTSIDHCRQFLLLQLMGVMLGGGGRHTATVMLMTVMMRLSTADAQTQFGIGCMEHGQCFGVFDVRLAQQILMGNRMGVDILDMMIHIAMVMMMMQMMMLVVVQERGVFFPVRTERTLQSVRRRAFVHRSIVLLFVVLESFLPPKVASVLEHITRVRMKCPEGSLARFVGRPRNFNKTIVETE